MKLLVIIPTYNEIENIEKLIHYIFKLPSHFDILIIDDNSPDGTAQIVKNLIKTDYSTRLHIIERSGKLGLGTAYILGFKWGLERNYNYLFEMDADFSHNPDDLERLIETAKKGYDLVVGSRYIRGGGIEGWPLNRWIYSYGGSIFAKMVTFLPIKDTTAGFVCYHKNVLNKMNLNTLNQKGYGFQIEMKYLAWKLGFKLKEIPITFKDRILGTSKMNNSIIYEAFYNVVKMQWTYLKGQYLKNKSNQN
ncbi:MAG: polyprenol monophosphomannose synthase [Alphaproteobacteria bacterium]|nr:polyprenol monophosphomannose synthase [Alphaproteobacteria bacterium]